ncbi:Uncharacterised protein [Candidatus Gugararchaeum adminiculabundum]|nr:Uncharacterised protein [Candidatus Gugararchaeum adminiculabundum]
MVKSVCIICEKEKDGEPLVNDYMLRFIRKIKQTLGVARNNQLVVCNDCFANHRKKREKFEKTIVQYVALGAISVVLLLVLFMRWESVIFSLLIIVFMLSLALLSYHPATKLG